MLQVSLRLLYEASKSLERAVNECVRTCKPMPAGSTPDLTSTDVNLHAVFWIHWNLVISIFRSIGIWLYLATHASLLVEQGPLLMLSSTLTAPFRLPFPFPLAWLLPSAFPLPLFFPLPLPTVNWSFWSAALSNSLAIVIALLISVVVLARLMLPGARNLQSSCNVYNGGLPGASICNRTLFEGPVTIIVCRLETKKNIYQK